MQTILAIDGMGGDNAPNAVLGGLSLAAQKFPHVHFLLFGIQDVVGPLLSDYPDLASVVTLVPCTDVVEAHTKPSVAIRGLKDSTMRRAIMAVREGKAAGVVSSGNTGALMALTKILLGTLEGIDRPAIGGLIPTIDGPRVMLDLGANTEITSENYAQFAVMGVAFARAALSKDDPTVGLLNIGSEDMKGHRSIRDAHQLMKDSGLFPQYVGFIEGNDIAGGRVDVIVSDGFTGNVALKTMEGTAKLLTHFLKDGARQTLLSKLGCLLARGAFDYLKEKLDPRLYNGAPFLGVKGISVKSHGGADAIGFANAVSIAIQLIDGQMNKRICEEIQQVAGTMADLIESSQSFPELHHQTGFLPS